MLNRRLLRIKVFKVLYSYAENPDLSLREAFSYLETSCESVRDLYLYMLGVIPPLTAYAAELTASARAKFNPTEEELHPNLKFVNNSLAPLFGSDPDFNKLMQKKKLSWEQNDAFIRSLYASIRGKEYYRRYMESPEVSVKEDVNLFIHIFEEEFVDNPDLEAILEDMSIWWNDDLAYALTVGCTSLKHIAKGGRWELPPLYQSDILRAKDPTVQSDKDFSTKLLAAGYSSWDKYFPMIAEKVTGWEKDRLFTTDIVLIILGLAEAATFPDIPVRVSINEYVEISKFYGTPRSSSFVNGLLDTLIKELIEEGTVRKTIC